MEIKNRLFPYPVLCYETDDYGEDYLGAEVAETGEDLNGIDIRVKFILNSSDIWDLIRSDKARFVAHLECTNTCYRKYIESDKPIIDYSIPKDKVNGIVTVLAMIVAKTRIDGYTSSELNEDYNDTLITFEKGSILAYFNAAKIDVHKDYEELAGNEPLFSVIKLGNEFDEPKPLEFDIEDSDRIKIFADPKTYNSYIHFRQNNTVAVSLLVLPALVYTIEILREDEEPYLEKHWYIRLDSMYKKVGKSLHAVLEDQPSTIALAQDMLNNPIAKTYSSLVEMEG